MEDFGLLFISTYGHMLSSIRLYLKGKIFSVTGTRTEEFEDVIYHTALLFSLPLVLLVWKPLEFYCLPNLVSKSRMNETKTWEILSSTQKQNRYQMQNVFLNACPINQKSRKNTFKVGLRDRLNAEICDYRLWVGTFEKARWGDSRMGWNRSCQFGWVRLVGM